MAAADGKNDDHKTGFSEEELAGLSENERAALEESDDDTDALRIIAGEGGGGDDDDDADAKAAAAADAKAKADADAAAKAKADEDAEAKEEAEARKAELAAMSEAERKKAEAEDQRKADEAAAAAVAAKKAEDDAAALARADEDDAPLVTTYRVEPPENYDARVKEFEDRKAAITQKHRDNEIDIDEMLAEHAGIDAERRKMDDQKLKYEIAQEQAEQQSEQRWQWEVNRFLKNIAKHEGIDYRANGALNGALDSEVKRLANDEANKGKPGEWFLQTAHDNVKQQLGIAGRKADAGGGDKDAAAKAETAKAKAIAERRKQADANRDKLVRGVGDLPAAGEGELGNEGEFSHLDTLDGMELENAVAKMTPDQQDRYARTN